jgi:hypothetical protein
MSEHDETLPDGKQLNAADPTWGQALLASYWHPKAGDSNATHKDAQKG